MLNQLNPPIKQTMKAEEVYNEENSYSRDGLIQKDVSIIAMKRYARLMIEKDRERVKAHLPGEAELMTAIRNCIDQTPIELD